jgi:iron complex outermembrane receptor protein
MIKKKYLTSAISAAIAVAASSAAVQSVHADERIIEEIMVTAEKRSESLQTLSQAVTAITANDMDNKNVMSFVDLSAIAPGVTVAKNEGFKTIISIRGVEIGRAHV